eukprot:TRINITY_DN5749_c0_g1_i1.p1 TRINITY_DN5749_c0_g1~~TRINITY_DN5749_c0_g1_i1.p1  ORF type:complete len:282 (+),score=72.09 TRINITY_DN5749_c0_g1_i1:52-897(+)
MSAANTCALPSHDGEQAEGEPRALQHAAQEQEQGECTAAEHVPSNAVLEVMSGRRSCRAFLRDRPVPRALLQKALSASTRTPSSKNAQPWAVTAVHGPARDALSELLRNAFLEHGEPPLHYKNRPADHILPPLWAERVFQQGKGFHEHLGIAREDKEGRLLQAARNFDFFDAPTELLFHVPSDCMTEGVLLHAGLFISSVVLALESLGLASCLQISVAKFSPLITATLGMHHRTVVCGCAVGYQDPTAPANAFVAARAPLSELYDEIEQLPPPAPSSAPAH